MIGYLGPQGTFSHLAALRYFSENTDLVPYPSIYSLIKAADSGEIESAIVPIENSIEGSVNATLDTLAFDAELFITGEFILKIDETLMARQGISKSDITHIISHPQPIAQCSRMIAKDFSNAVIEYADSTASAAKTAAVSDIKYGVIGPENLAGLYGLDILFCDCGDESNNSTRFVTIERTANKTVSNNDKTSIAFTLDNRPGSLYNALEMFASQKINMIKIESRPVKKELGKYVFFIDIDGNIDDAEIFFALEKIRASTQFFKFLGSYPKAVSKTP